MCIGGLDTVKYFEQFNDGSEEFEKAIERDERIRHDKRAKSQN